MKIQFPASSLLSLLALAPPLFAAETVLVADNPAATSSALVPSAGNGGNALSVADWTNVAAPPNSANWTKWTISTNSTDRTNWTNWTNWKIAQVTYVKRSLLPPPPPGLENQLIFCLTNMSL